MNFPTIGENTNFFLKCRPANKLKSLKVAQVKDEMDDDEDDGCDGVCDAA